MVSRSQHWKVRFELHMLNNGMFTRHSAQLDPFINIAEVFLLVARGHSADKQEFASSIRRGNETLLTDDAEKSARSKMDLDNEGLLGRHIVALFKKRAAFFRRDKKAWMCTTILPGLFVLMGFLIFKLIPTDSQMDELKLTFDRYNPDIGGENVRNPVAFNDPSEPFLCQPGFCSYNWGLGLSSDYFEPFFENPETDELYGFCGIEGSVDLLNAVPGEEGSFEGIEFSDLVDPASLPETLLSSCSTISSANIMSHLPQDDGFEAVPEQVSNVTETSTALHENRGDFAGAQYGAIFFTHELESVITDESSTPFTNATVGLCNGLRDNLGVSYTSEADCDRLAGLGYLIQYNFTALHSSPLYQALVDQLLVNQYRADIGSQTTFEVEASVHPLPFTKVEDGYTEAQDATSAWMLVLLSFPFISGAFGSFVVAERESKAKHLQTVAGVEPSAYWISTLLWDTANYMIPCFLVVALMFAFDVSVLTTTNRNVLSGVIATLVCFGPAVAGFAYVSSFFFTSPAFCNVFLIVSGFLIGFGGPLTCFILIIIGRDPGNPKPNLEDIANIISWILRLFFPTFNLGRGLLNVINIEALDFLYGESKTAWTKEVLLYDVIFLVVQAVVFLMLAIRLDIMSTNPSRVAMWKKFLDIVTLRACFGGGKDTIDITVALPEDEDVIAEQDRVAAGGANSDLIVLNELTKVYDNGKVAVNNVSFGIPPGECFGYVVGRVKV